MAEVSVTEGTRQWQEMEPRRKAENVDCMGEGRESAFAYSELQGLFPLSLAWCLAVVSKCS